ncbi:phosphatase PAP2 family protein [Microbacterium sp. AISO3]|uniref:phosphatase PAP2 family protein n=1 Tax=unclassified Microbacterium TaxID=2609290 RepID=UPI000B4D92BC|nr:MULTISPECIES: phosphatase PAP2 family protein [unclassified Microbacterium]OWP21184.1 phosphatase PAP2 family protein [Microbacterium sp. AISO3]POX67599.1 PAP2 family protein [Microbacterium sp. Ru50]
MNDAPPTDPRRLWPRRAAIGIVLMVAGALLGWWLFTQLGQPFAVDRWWNETLPADPGAVGLVFGLVMNRIGGTWVGVFAIPIAVAVALIVLRRPWAAGYFLVASALSALVVQLIKHLVDRSRPEDILVTTDAGSFPSGHTANAATIAVVAVILFPRIWVAIIGVVWTVLMALSRTVVHAHWLSDTVGGMLVGAGVALVVAAMFTEQLERERRAVQERRG